jgi:hypothetical protein
MIELVQNKDIEIFFNADVHKYTDQFYNNYTSVTTLINKYVPEFKKEYWAARKANETNKSYKQVLKEWEDINTKSINNGNKTHGILEDNIKSRSIFNRAIVTVNAQCGNRVFSVNDIDFSTDTTNISYEEFAKNLPKEFESILPTIKYYVDKGYKIYSEINVFHPYYLISGTIDVLLINNNREFIIIDWKTNRKELHFKSGYYKKSNGIETNEWVSKDDRLLYPLDNLPNCHGAIYTLQLSIYAILLESFGFIKKGLILYHIRDTVILNEYGRPIVNPDGSYTVDRTQGKIINPYVIDYYKLDAERLIKTYNKDLRLYNQQKLM